MSDTCKPFPPFGDPWPSCLLAARYVPVWNGRGVWGRMGTCICMTESLRCSLETITTLLIVCFPIKNAFGVKNKILQILQDKNRISKIDILDVIVTGRV